MTPMQEQQVEIAERRQQLSAAHALIGTLVVELKGVEYSPDGACPCCGHYSPALKDECRSNPGWIGHAPDCTLHAAIQQADEFLAGKDIETGDGREERKALSRILLYLIFDIGPAEDTLNRVKEITSAALAGEAVGDSKEERYRQALEKISKWDRLGEGPYTYTRDDIRDIARAALATHQPAEAEGT